MLTELISIIANIALALSFVVALVFGIAQVRGAARERRERLTLEHIRTFETRESAELMEFISSSRMPTTREELEALAPAERAMYIQFSQQMESLGILVAEGFIDLDLVDKTLGSFVAATWKKYKPLFREARETQAQPDPFAGEYFQWLAERIHQRMRDNPREPVYKNPV